MGCPWEGWLPATMRFCEEGVCTWVRHPANAWTNLAYLAAGIVILLLHRGRGRRDASLLLAPIAAAVGITSFLYHASGSFFFQVFDLASMYLLSAFLLAANITRLMRRPLLLWPMFAGSFGVSLGTLLVVRGQSGAVIFMIEIAAAVGLEIALIARERAAGRPPPSFRPYAAALACYGLALAVWILDLTRLWCNPADHLLQGHALWHILNAPSIVFICLFYRGKVAAAGKA